MPLDPKLIEYFQRIIQAIADARIEAKEVAAFSAEQFEEYGNRLANEWEAAEQEGKELSQ